MATMSPPKRTLSRSSRRGSRRSSTVARLHATAIAAKNRRASIAMAAAMEEKAFLEESKSSSSIASSKSSMSVASKSSSMVGSKSSYGMCEKSQSSSPDSSRRLDVSDGSVPCGDGISLAVERQPILHRRSFDSASSSTSSDLLKVSGTPDVKSLAVSDTCIDAKQSQFFPPNRHIPLDQRLTINLPYQTSPRKSFDATCPRRRASSSPRPSISSAGLTADRPLSRRPSRDVAALDQPQIDETSFVSDPPTPKLLISRNSSLRSPSFPREVPVHRKSSLSNSTRRKSRLLPDDIPKALEPTILASRKASLAIETSSRKASMDIEPISLKTSIAVVPPSRKASLVIDQSLRKASLAPDLATWKATMGIPLTESSPRTSRLNSTASNYSHLDIYRRNSSSASRTSAPAETGIRGTYNIVHIIILYIQGGPIITSQL